MTAPAEDPRGGEVCGCRSAYIHGYGCTKFAAPPAAGRGDTDSGGEREHGKVPGSETSENGYLGACWCQGRGDAWPCPSAARPAGGRAQPTQELREAICDEIAGWPIGSGYYQYTVTTDDAGELADALIAGPLAALLAKLLAVEELVDELMTERSLVPDIARRAAADRIRRALGGPS